MSVLIPGKTCWRTEPSDRAAFLVDTEAYFTALYEAFKKARRSILILGWGFDPRARLFPDGFDGPDDPDEVGHVLLRLAAERPELDIRLLIWKSALPIAASQEFFPHKARKWFEGTPISFHLDDQVPMGACHHQKVVVIDDRLAFCGGGDISVDRWDSQGHLDDDQRRIMPDQQCHDPRHEVMMMVDGAAARSLGDYFRLRWRNAVKDEEIAPPPDAGGDPWPDHVPAHLIQPQVSIARTTPAWRGRPCVQEILDLTLACIATARETIYLENQYFSSPVITEALARRLAEPEGPEVVLITTGQSPSWFDQLTMDHARGSMIWRLRAADIFGRFRAFYPTTPSGQKIIVHSKTSIFDDRIVRVGSANINNRSYGFDTEIELAVECDEAESRTNVAVLRDRLVGHFIGHSGDAVSKARAQRGSLVRAIDDLNRAGRLTPIDCSPQSKVAEFIAAYHLGDPADVVDSWRPWRRRERLYFQARDLAPPQATVEVHHQGQVIGGHPAQWIVGGRDVCHPDVRAHEQVVDPQYGQLRREGRGGLLARRQPPGRLQPLSQGAIDQRTGRGVEVAQQDRRPPAVGVPQPRRSGQVRGLELLLLRHKAQVGVDDLHRPPIDLDLDPQSAARLQRADPVVAGQWSHLHQPLGQ